MELKSFETAITHERDDFFAFHFCVREARGDVRSQCKKRVGTMSGKRPSAISSFPFIKLEVLNGKPHIQKGVKRIAVPESEGRKKSGLAEIVNNMSINFRMAAPCASVSTTHAAFSNFAQSTKNDRCNSCLEYYNK